MNRSNEGLLASIVNGNNNNGTPVTDVEIPIRGALIKNIKILQNTPLDLGEGMQLRDRCAITSLVASLEVDVAVAETDSPLLLSSLAQSEEHEDVATTTVECPNPTPPPPPPPSPVVFEIPPLSQQPLVLPEKEERNDPFLPVDDGSFLMNDYYQEEVEVESSNVEIPVSSPPPGVSDASRKGKKRGRKPREPNSLSKVCSVCGKGFNNFQSCQRHEKIHSGTFHCTDDPINCASSFTNKTSLTKHRQAAHGFRVHRDQTVAGKERKMLAREHARLDN